MQSEKKLDQLQFSRNLHICKKYKCCQHMNKNHLHRVHQKISSRKESCRTPKFTIPALRKPHMYITQFICI